MCTRDLDYGAGSYVKMLLKELDKNDEIKKIYVIAPKKLDGFSNKVEFFTVKLFGNFIIKIPLFSFKVRCIIKNIIASEKIDLIHTHHSMFFRNSKIPIIFTVHSLHDLAYRNNPFSNLSMTFVKMFHIIYEFLDYFQMKNSNKILFASKKTMEYSEGKYKKYSQKFIFYPNFVDTTLFYPFNLKIKDLLREKYGLNKNKKYLLFVGRLEPLKGVSNLANIIKELKMKNQNIELLIVGDGPLKDQISRNDFVKYLGKIPHHIMSEIYNVSDFFVLPSFYENSPMTILEAMSCGLPVISTEVGDAKSIIRNNDMLIKKPDSFSIKNKLEFLFGLSDTRIKDIGKINRKRIINCYSSKKNTNKILKVYRDVS